MLVVLDYLVEFLGELGWLTVKLGADVAELITEIVGIVCDLGPCNCLDPSDTTSY